MLAGAQAAAAAGNVSYHTGPVSRSMTGVVVSWGSSVNSAYTNDTTGDPGLIKYLAANSGSTGDIGGVLAQYMDNTGHNAANAVTYGGQYAITPSDTSTTVDDSDIQTELVNQIQAANLPRPAGDGLQTMYLVLFPSGDTECFTDNGTTYCSGSDFCSYHGNATLPDGTNVLYAVLPDNMSGAMMQGCGNASSLLADQTSYLSHEWSETITDPLGTAWWNNSSGNEVGDNCNAQQTTNGSWTVQLEWSNIDRACLGAEPAYRAPVASFLAPGSGGAGQPVSFDASSSSDPSTNKASISGTGYSISPGIATYSWNWGDGTTSGPSATATAGHTYAATGTYQVSLTVTDKLGFTSTVTKPISIGAPAPPSPTATTGTASNVSQTGATLGGTVNPEGQSVQYRFSYGTSPSSLDQTTPLTTGPTGTSATPVSATLSGLQSGTTYYFRLDVVAGGQTYTGSIQSFTTSAAPAPPPQPAQSPTVATGSASQVTTSSALLTGTINPGGSQPVTYHFAYGTSAGNLVDSTPETSAGSGTTAVPVSATVGSLKARTTYYFELVVSLNGQSFSGSFANFTTLTPGPGASTGPVVRVTSNGAVVFGVVYPNGIPTTYFVEFGTTTRYGHSTAPLQAGAGTSGVPVNVSLAGLSPSTRYHYRLVATSAGGTAVGSDRSFVTQRAPGRAPHFGFRMRRRFGVRAAQHGKMKVRFSCSKGCTARFSVTIASAGVTRFAPVPLTLAHGSGRIRAKGTGTATISFIPAIRSRLGRYRHLRLIVSGYAISTGSAPSAPLTASLTLT